MWFVFENFQHNSLTLFKWFLPFLLFELILELQGGAGICYYCLSYQLSKSIIFDTGYLCWHLTGFILVVFSEQTQRYTR